MSWVERTTLIFIHLAVAAAVLGQCLASIYARLPLAHGWLLDAIAMGVTLLGALCALGCWHACTWFLSQRPVRHQAGQVATFKFCAESAR